MPKLISIAEIEEGMTLSSPILNSFGQVLLNEGTELTAKHKNMLKMWSIASVSIKTTASDSEQDYTPEILDKARELLLQKMDWQPRNQLEEELLYFGIVNIAKTLRNHPELMNG